ncbi:MoaD/ThiS family protein [Anthocerotibacter panamensis]|uniref:MoaD/ThiS family protein n=1 Tax=Anthocerotibacter panamensis TaxID=2857077 RepID=UPI001C407512|nr:MoaD/ThiS family protein [Anthocerotibacter panamensis]
MAVKVIIPTPLRRYTANQESLELEGATIGEILAQLTHQYADLKKHLYTEEGTLRNFVNVYLNDEDIRHLQKSQTPVQSSDIVSIVPSIAGGSLEA